MLMTLMRNRDPRGRLPEYVGKRIRYALVLVDLENRQPWKYSGFNIPTYISILRA